MSTKQNYYDVLGISHDSPQEYIKRAFRRLAFKYHPDHNTDDGAADKFKEISEAYEILSDPDKRARYDHLGHRPHRPKQDFEGVRDFISDWGHAFETFFGSTIRSRKRTSIRGTNLYQTINISFQDAIRGCEREIEIVRTEHCCFCHGIGHEPGTNSSTCPNCNGTGQVKQVQQNTFGRYTNIATCERCGSEGTIMLNPCPQCHGMGREAHHRKIKVSIPAGIEDSSSLRLRGEGEAGDIRNPPGDLLISIEVTPHEFFQRDGYNILYALSINFAQAALGDTVEVPTLDGNISLPIPPGTQTGHIFCLEGKGVPPLRGTRQGHQIVEVRVVTPQNLTQTQRKLLDELANTLDTPR